MGRDEHNKSRGRNRLVQTPKNEKTDGRDVEFSRELADQEDMEALERSRQADQRVKRS
ncbi:YfhD family protein [Virgibacillus kekensis]|uniref:YfhD family protein n=1 Tax=Virgibacillus kekensis TaxID=202261 RepID=A0ABV9DKY5_9BACI